MGHTTLRIENLLPPFSVIQERYIIVPPEQEMQLDNDRFKLLFFLEGGLHMTLSDGRSRRIEEGDAVSLSLPVTQRYRGLNPRRETRVHVLRLDFVWPCTLRPNNPPKRRPRTSAAQFEDALRSQLEGYHHFPRSRFGDHHRLLRTILMEMEHDTPSTSWKVSGLCLTLLGSLLAASEAPPRQTAPSVKGGAAAIAHVRQYLEENCHERLTLTSIAWRVQLSAEHLARLFKQHTGETVFEHLDHLRMEKAKRLLVTSEWPLARVARDCGFSCPSLFNRHFRTRIGCPPNRFRLQARAQETSSPSKFRRPVS